MCRVCVCGGWEAVYRVECVIVVTLYNTARFNKGPRPRGKYRITRIFAKEQKINLPFAI